MLWNKHRYKILHPFLFAAFPLLFLLVYNFDQIYLSQIFFPLIFIECLTALLFFVLNIILKNEYKAAIILSLGYILFFSYGHIFEILPDGLDISDRLLSSIFIYIFGIVVFFIVASYKDFKKITSFFYYTACVLLIFILFNTGFFIWQNSSYWFKPLHTGASFSQEMAFEDFSVKNESLPDVYYIVLDRYASNDTLKNYYNFDNSPFLNHLKDKGFYVAEESKANYMNTALSLASSLNMGYLDILAENVGSKARNKQPLYQMIQNNQVLNFFKKLGYRSIHLGSWWDPTRKNKNADENYNIFSAPEFIQMIYKSSMLKAFGTIDARREQWNRVLYQFDTLKKIALRKKPTFVFAHLIVPHQPFVFDEEGSFVSYSDEAATLIKESYIKQLQFINKKIIELLDVLLSDEKSQPIIILQSDEGPYPERFQANLEEFEWDYATSAELNEKMGILNALYLPELDTKILYKDISPVNTFRIIFSQYFGVRMGMLKDRMYANPYKEIYNFFEITERYNK